MPPEVHLVGPLVCKIVLLAAASAGGLALFFSRFGGCDWMGSVWRTAVAATVVAFLGGLFAGPLQRAITPTVKKEFTPEGQALAQNPAQASKQP
jgi:uncharacterized oligopeptide transporter (OPT) family protein